MDSKKISTKKILLTTGIAISLSFLIDASSIAGVYRWVDANGQVNYSDQPASSSAEKIDIHTSKPTTPVNEEATDEAEEKAKNAPATEDKTEQPVAEPVEPEVPKISRKDKRKYCNEAKNDIATISSRGRMREISAKGEYTYLTEEQRQQRLSAARKKQREFCR